MKLETRLDQARVRGHFQYNFWKYLVLILASFFIWDLIYAYTAYRPPQEKRIDIYLQNASATQEHMDEHFMSLARRVTPEVEVVSTVTLLGNTQTDIYAAPQLTTYLYAQEGDLYFLGGDDFKRFAAQGVFLDLEAFVESGVIPVGGMPLQNGYVAIQAPEDDSQSSALSQERKLYGIPAASLPGLWNEFGIDNRDLYLSVTVFNQNDANVIPFLGALVAETRETEAVDGGLPR